jgi:hypothetical protein
VLILRRNRGSEKANSVRLENASRVLGVEKQGIPDTRSGDLDTPSLTGQHLFDKPGRIVEIYGNGNGEVFWLCW